MTSATRLSLHVPEPTDTGPEITYVGRARPPKPQTRRSGLSAWFDGDAA